ncbi:hypothetical protein CKAN_00195600 [Cinnamomum micranthum f. kanehirae]|uniref:Uncharacterized protein n=1 Tax=Cinnamomum micranthum f. kanehirae TaxID=337451 RepID=A0A443N566_9MAGN|nr:hypothetical protein CKAN_00195600 [Cinnamomum micranthum f. kanehirae]
MQCVVYLLSIISGLRRLKVRKTVADRSRAAQPLRGVLAVLLQFFSFGVSLLWSSLPVATAIKLVGGDGYLVVASCRVLSVPCGWIGRGWWLHGFTL